MAFDGGASRDDGDRPLVHAMHAVRRASASPRAAPPQSAQPASAAGAGRGGSPHGRGKGGKFSPCGRARGGAGGGERRSLRRQLT